MLEAPAGRYLAVNGNRLFVDERGNPGAPPVLVVHGGPGEGCWDFMAVQGDRLARTLRVIGVDQRGCLRSDPLPAGATLALDDIVADLDELRDHLGIPAWALLGHSFGANIALRYATTHPERVGTVVFENPTWDDPALAGHLLPRVLAIFDAVGDTESAARCRLLLTDNRDGTPAAFRERLEVVGRLGAAYADLYLHDRDAYAAMKARHEATSLPESWFQRGSAHGQALLNNPDFFTSVLPLLRRLACPSLLIRGAFDPVTSDLEVRAYAAQPGTRVVVAERSAQFVHSEQPDLFEDLVVAHLAR